MINNDLLYHIIATITPDSISSAIFTVVATDPPLLIPAKRLFKLVVWSWHVLGFTYLNDAIHF
jgi:hypothetical protein